MSDDDLDVLLNGFVHDPNSEAWNKIDDFLKDLERDDVQIAFDGEIDKDVFCYTLNFIDPIISRLNGDQWIGCRFYLANMPVSSVPPHLLNGGRLLCVQYRSYKISLNHPLVVAFKNKIRMMAL